MLNLLVIAAVRPFCAFAVSKLVMRQLLLRWAVAVPFAFLVACSSSQVKQQPEVSAQASPQSPFSISVVPTTSRQQPYGRGISMAKKSPGSFYVVVTNISTEPQSAFEAWNSWGYQAVWFEVQAADGRKFTISKKPQEFTINFPSTFVIPPGEHMVYAISLNDEWNAVPPLPMADQTPIPITLKAIYEVKPTPEATKQQVWTGRLESRDYQMKLRHW